MQNIKLLVVYLFVQVFPTMILAEGIGLPQGRFVEVEQHRMHINCTGQGEVTIVVDAGIGGSSAEWFLVRERLDSTVRFCAYDRAGYGWSDPGVSARTTENITSELHQLLSAAGETPPYILVGHSFGGFTSRYFTHKYPNEVVGLVLVDASHPDQTERMQKLVTGTEKRTNGSNPLIMPEGKRTENLPEPYRTQASFLNSRRKAIFAQMDEIKYFNTSAEQVRSAMPLPNVPVVVITRGIKVWPDDEEGRQMEMMWRELQSSLASITSRGRQRVAEVSGHNVHLDQPELVSTEIFNLLNEVTLQPFRLGVVGIDH